MKTESRNIHIRKGPPSWAIGMEVRKVQADSVPYGEQISRNGRTVFAAYYGTELLAVAASSAEVRIKYRAAILAREKAERMTG